MKKYIADSNFVLRKIAGEAVLVAVGSGVADFRGIITLNSTAEELWKMLKSGATKDELVKMFCKSFDVSEDTAAADIEETLHVLEEKGLVKSE